MSGRRIIDYIKYTMKHRKAFREVEKRLNGRNSIRGYIHDLDKVILYLILGIRLTNKIHRRFSKHHRRAICEKDYLQQIIDWQSAPITKEDKPYNAYQTMKLFHNNEEGIYMHLLLKYGLITREGKMQNADLSYTNMNLDKVKVMSQSLGDWIYVYVSELKDVYDFLSKAPKNYNYKNDLVVNCLREDEACLISNNSTLFRLCNSYIMIGTMESSFCLYLSSITNMEFIKDILRDLLKYYPYGKIVCNEKLSIRFWKKEMKEYTFIANDRSIEVWNAK